MNSPIATEGITKNTPLSPAGIRHHQKQPLSPTSGPKHHREHSLFPLVLQGITENTPWLPIYRANAIAEEIPLYQPLLKPQLSMLPKGHLITPI